MQLPVSSSNSSSVGRHQNALAYLLCWTATTIVILPGAFAFLPSQFSVQQYAGSSNSIINSLRERQQLKRPLLSFQGFSTSSSWTDDSCRRNSGGVDLSMAFHNSEDDSNIFDGPMALTKERDACGVGFIANTQSGGQSFIFFARPVSIF